MRLVRFQYKHQIGIGAVIDNMIVPAWLDSALPTTLPELFAASASTYPRLQNLQGQADIPLADVQLLAPIPNPQKFLGVGLNYKDHIAETGLDTPDFPTVFNKQSSCIIGPGAAIHRPAVSDKLDYEGELALVIGKRCRHVAYAQAHEVIAGYTIVNDVSVRDWQANPSTPTALWGLILSPQTSSTRITLT